MEAAIHYFLVALILVGLKGLTKMAKTHYRTYKKMFPWLLLVCSSAVSSIATGFIVVGNFVGMLLPLAALIGVIIYLLILYHFQNLLM